MKQSKTQQAIALVDSGMTPYAAADKIGITPTTLYTALKKRKREQELGVRRCPTCGHLLGDGDEEGK